MASLVVRDAGAAAPPHVLVDALPYLDNEYDEPEMQAVVHQLIESEMSTMPRKDYLAHLPPPPIPSQWGTPLMDKELGRLADQDRPIPLDLSRYEVNQPSGALAKDPQAWRSAVSNAKAQLEHQHNRLVNLELLQKFGAQAWLQQNKALETMASAVEQQAERAAKAAEASNLKRKHTQEKAGPRLGNLQYEVRKAVEENMQLNLACALLRRDTKRLKTAVVARGLKTADELDTEEAAAEAAAAASQQPDRAPEWKDVLMDAMDS